MNRPALPQYWSPEQALAVYELLQYLREQLRQAYRADLVGLLDNPPASVLQALPSIHPASLKRYDDFDDTDLPF